MFIFLEKKSLSVLKTNGTSFILKNITDISIYYKALSLLAGLNH